MTAYIADCETDGLLPELTTIHSLVLMDISTHHIYSCHDHAHEWTNPREGQGLTTLTIDEGLRLLEKTDDFAVFHNGIKFDKAAITKVKPWFKAPKMRDTLLLSWLLWPEIKQRDFVAARNGFPKKMIGSHSLKAWGYRLGNYKGDFEGPWDRWQPAMQTYCEQDVEVTRDLWTRCAAKNYSEVALDLEHDFADVCGTMERDGVPFDKEAAIRLYATLCQRRLEMERDLKAAFLPWFAPDGTEDKRTFTPKRDNKKSGYTAGCPLTKVKLVEFNPGSRAQVGDRLMKTRGWKPTAFGADGKPTIDDEVLADLAWPEAKMLTEFFTVEKRIGALAEGKQAWLKFERDSYIHGQLDSCKAISRRGIHRNPNMGQVPSVKNANGVVPYGAECRALFHAPAGYNMIGADASGIQLKILAHYLARYDGGRYIDLVMNGDVHEANKEAGGGLIDTREQAKRFIYAFILGCAAPKAGEIVGKGPRQGKKLIDNFLSANPAIKSLKEDIGKALQKNHGLKAIDGGFLTIRSEHAALSSLLQSGEACIVKRATVEWKRELIARGHGFGRMRDVWLALHVHDELQSIAKETIADEVGKLAVEKIREAGEFYKFKLPFNGEYKIGRNWKDTH